MLHCVIFPPRGRFASVVVAHSTPTAGHTLTFVAAASSLPADRAGNRDVRLDLFRGLALICIFIDHTPGNLLGYVTMRAYGLSDAAETFVLIAGYTAVLAYSRVFEQHGLFAGAKRVGARIWDLYAAHILLTAVCALGLALAARWFENPLYYEYVNLTPYAYDPFGAIWRTMVLYYQLGYLNILPLYIALLAWFPILWWLMQRDLRLAFAVSFAIWLVPNLILFNLPSWPDIYGWFFNPFAWQLLFSCGAIAAVYVQRGGVLPRAHWVTAVAIAYVVFAFVVAAPWVAIDGLEGTRLIHPDSLGPNSKSRLSLWRLTHILALAYLVALYLPAGARWLKSWPSQMLINCGRNSLVTFCLGTVLSFIGFVAMLEGGRGLEYQVAVNVVGIGLLGCTAWWLMQRKRRLAVGVGKAAQTQPSAVPEETRPR